MLPSIAFAEASDVTVSVRAGRMPGDPFAFDLWGGREARGTLLTSDHLVLSGAKTD